MGDSAPVFWSSKFSVEPPRPCSVENARSAMSSGTTYASPPGQSRKPPKSRFADGAADEDGGAIMTTYVVTSEEGTFDRIASLRAECHFIPRNERRVSG